eukprot:TRINITY_DN23268_c0_g1_i3.p1 TRINITY_DN23268_c0_g1~~TRINITY_DN23268_c0_g1_i3.p1  ORF type:complete len:314 (-),score=59.00 TRINITY_DN23268_c0_g1_i3:480-1421(-)
MCIRDSINAEYGGLGFFPMQTGRMGRPASAPSNRRKLTHRGSKQRGSPGVYVQGTFEPPLQHLRTHDSVPYKNNKSSRRPVSAFERSSRSRARIPRSTEPPQRRSPGLRSRLRNQYDELNVLERIFDDIMMFGDGEADEPGGYYYSKLNDELMTESEFLEFVEAHPEQLDQCCDVDVAMEEMLDRWKRVSQRLDEQHWSLSASLMQAASVDDQSERELALAQAAIRENFSDLRQELAQREEALVAEVEQIYLNKVRGSEVSTQVREEQLDRVDRCRELGNRLCQNLKPVAAPHPNPRPHPRPHPGVLCLSCDF